MAQTGAGAAASLLLRVFAATALIIAVMSPNAGARSDVTLDAGTDNQLGLTFSPDGATAFWVAWNGDWGSSTASTRVIYTARRQKSAWSTPAPAKFTTDHSDSDPFVSPDGLWLYFVSERPVSSDDESSDRNIWRYGLAEEGRLEYLSINSAAAEYSPVVTESGTLYFASNRDGGSGQGDLYRATPVDDGFGAPQTLGPAFNTPTGEWNLWVAADEKEIIFEASSRPTNVSIPGDLYYSWRTVAGWTPAISIRRLNTRHSDLMPRLHPDGKTLYYTSAPIGGHAQTLITAWMPLREQLRSAFAPKLLVANRSSHEVTFIDLSRGEIVASVATGEGPHLLSNVSEGRVAATGYGDFPKPHATPVTRRPPFATAPNSRFTLIDTAKQTVLLDTVIAECAKPHASWLIKSRAYVTCEKEQRIAVIDLHSGRTIQHFETQQAGSHVLSFEPESRVLASSNVDSGSITLIHVDTGATKIVALAAGSEGALAIAGRFWVANGTDGSVSIADPHTGAVIGHIDSVCQFPIALSQDSRRRVWVACFASAELVSIDADTFAIRRRISLDDQPLNVLTHPERLLAYVSLPRQNAVAEIDLESGQELRRIAVGIEPDGLRWAVPVL